ncbi:MAG: Glutamate--tRNA ligase [Candidatus Marinimicrobia bacterium]|nr:Glutamate--tRNA ligase [Candidatus Neomarinimicrobiota bacterium]
MTPVDSDIRVRFAPSPTGYLHVGGARTAIFNWLFARQNNGKFLIRIEDTDTERSKAAMVEKILESMEWLGLRPDEEVVYQSNNIQAHKDAVDRLLSEGKAYRCFCTPEALEQKRQKAKSDDDTAYQYDGTCRDWSEETIRQNLDAGKEFAVRFRVDEGWVNFKDRIYKKISVNKSEIDDFIIQRRDGTPVYQLAVVADDAEMGITNVIRGEDHLSNTPKQILLYIALGYEVPKFAHLPLILGSDGKRLSKRHGATSVDEYKQRGYLHTAILNYLSLLGWTPKSNEEIFFPNELIEQFDMLRVSKSSAIFDQKKLDWVSGEHFSRWDTADLVGFVKLVLVEENIAGEDEFDEEYLHDVIELLQSRVTTLYDFAKFGSYFWNAPQKFDTESAGRFWPDESVNESMGVWLKRLKALDDFSPDSLETALRDCAEAQNIKAAQLIHPTRLAITGMGISPGIFQVMGLLGKDQLITRIGYAIEHLPH